MMAINHLVEGSRQLKLRTNGTRCSGPSFNHLKQLGAYILIDSTLNLTKCMTFFSWRMSSRGARMEPQHSDIRTVDGINYAPAKQHLETQLVDRGVPL
jgi:hypothetical protein